MALLGIDFGKKRVGLAMSESGLQAEPLQVITYSNKNALFEELR
jgi:RNase H-fold protein (predicted Holliday junction resolvase)